MTKRYYLQPAAECGSIIGIDDFAFKKRHTYGTIIVDQATHKPVAILEGRDGLTLKEWLKNNKHVKTITRDRASAYSSVIQEILPDAIQVADRFHLHQNLLEAIKNTVNSVIPVDIRIPIENTEQETSVSTEEPCKKMQCNVDNSSDYNEKSVQLYNAIHEYANAGHSKREIAKLLHCSRNTVKRYLTGDYHSLCRKNFHNGMDKFYDFIIKELSSGVCRKDVYRNLMQKGYKGNQTAAYDYMNKIIERFHIDIALYRSSSADVVQKRTHVRWVSFKHKNWVRIKCKSTSINKVSKIQG